MNGGTPTSDPANWDGDIAWATPVDLAQVNGSVLTSTERTLTQRGLETGSRSVAPPALIVSTRAPIGYVAEARAKMAFNQGCRGLSPIDDADSRYFRYQLLSMAEQLTAAGQGSTFVELTTEALASTQVIVPPVAAQRAIADFLDRETARIDALIEKKRRMIQVFEARRMSVMHDGVTGRLIGQALAVSRLPWLEAKPSHWGEVKLTLVARLGSGHTPGRDHPEWWEGCTIPWITTGEVAQMRSDRIEYIKETREMISEIGLANSAAEVHPDGTVVLCRTASVGYSAIMARDMATSQDFATWTCGPLIRPRFLLLCLRVMRQDLLGRLAMGSTHKTIYVPDIQSIRVPLPPVVEQDAIVESGSAKARSESTASRIGWRPAGRSSC